MEQFFSPKYLYKIVPSAPPKPIPAQYPLSSLDSIDGFIHLSTAVQVPLTADKFFSTAQSLWLIKLDFAKLADSVKWEGDFPHLYGSFGAKDVHAVQIFMRTEGQSWMESMRASSWME